MMGLGVGRGGWHKQRPQRGQCGGRVEAVGGGERFQHIRNRRFTSVETWRNDNEPQPGGQVGECVSSILRQYRTKTLDS